MDLEEIANKIADAIAYDGTLDVPVEPTEELRSGGFFFEVVAGDTRAIVTVTEENR